jgi:hypothetical protein
MLKKDNLIHIIKRINTLTYIFISEFKEDIYEDNKENYVAFAGTFTDRKKHPGKIFIRVLMVLLGIIKLEGCFVKRSFDLKICY